MHMDEFPRPQTPSPFYLIHRPSSAHDQPQQSTPQPTCQAPLLPSPDLPKDQPPDPDPTPACEPNVSLLAAIEPWSVVVDAPALARDRLVGAIKGSVHHRASCLLPPSSPAPSPSFLPSSLRPLFFQAEVLPSPYARSTGRTMTHGSSTLHSTAPDRSVLGLVSRFFPLASVVGFFCRGATLASTYDNDIEGDHSNRAIIGAPGCRDDAFRKSQLTVADSSRCPRSCAGSRGVARRLYVQVQIVYAQQDNPGTTVDLLRYAPAADLADSTRLAVRVVHLTPRASVLVCASAPRADACASRAMHISAIFMTHALFELACMPPADIDETRAEIRAAVAAKDSVNKAAVDRFFLLDSLKEFGRAQTAG
ncbi:hypothetical protein GGX14DRAFT_570172 [Mycena pura]|uniref:Uncharacterized protein n=1 Tax=Mycena pura TaxID=153505 RepID=A0AAD6V579_9AGAR|nr:hypothetical protein GGX14DRAFT_570172 [Mycena pura]